MRKIARHLGSAVSLILLEEKLAVEQGLQIWKCSCGCGFVSVYYAAFHLEKKHPGELFEDRIQVRTDFIKDSAKWRQFYTDISENIYNALASTSLGEKSSEANISDNLPKSVLSAPVPADSAQLPNGGAVAIEDSTHTSRKRSGKDGCAEHIVEKRLKLSGNVVEEKMTGESSQVKDSHSHENSAVANVDGCQSFLETSSLQESGFASFSELADQNNDLSAISGGPQIEAKVHSFSEQPVEPISMDCKQIPHYAKCELKDPRQDKAKKIGFKSIYRHGFKLNPKVKLLPKLDTFLESCSKPVDIELSPTCTSRSETSNRVLERIKTEAVFDSAPSSPSGTVRRTLAMNTAPLHPIPLQVYSPEGLPLYPEERMMIVPQLENRVIPNPVYYPYPNYTLVHSWDILFYPNGAPRRYQIQKWDNFYQYVMKTRADPNEARVSWMYRYVPHIARQDPSCHGHYN